VRWYYPFLFTAQLLAYWRAARRTARRARTGKVPAPTA
jgi:hypothetical protein